MYGKHYSTRTQIIIQKERVLHSLLTTSSPCINSTPSPQSLHREGSSRMLVFTEFKKFRKTNRRVRLISSILTEKSTHVRYTCFSFVTSRQGCCHCVTLTCINNSLFSQPAPITFVICCFIHYSSKLKEFNFHLETK